jgi:hypothetical protein
VVINLGTNDNNSANNVTTPGYVAQYTLLIEGIHAVWPKTQIILIVSSSEFTNSVFELTRLSHSGKVSETSVIPMSNRLSVMGPRCTRYTNISTRCNIFRTLSCIVR